LGIRRLVSEFQGLTRSGYSELELYYKRDKNTSLRSKLQIPRKKLKRIMDKKVWKEEFGILFLEPATL